MSRVMAREVAMKRLYAYMLGGEMIIAAVLAVCKEEEAPEKPPVLTRKNLVFSEKLFDGVCQYIEPIDKIIEDRLTSWSMDQMPKVDLCILRLAVFELLFCEGIPLEITIHEAVTLGSRFGGEKTADFINGLLGAMAKEGDKDSWMHKAKTLDIV